MGVGRGLPDVRRPGAEVGPAKDAACLQEVGVVGGGEPGCISLWTSHASYSFKSSDFAGWLDAGSLAHGNLEAGGGGLL